MDRLRLPLSSSQLVWLEGGTRVFTVSWDLLLTECFGGELHFTSCRVMCVELMLGSVELASTLGAGSSLERTMGPVLAILCRWFEQPHAGSLESLRCDRELFSSRAAFMLRTLLRKGATNNYWSASTGDVGVANRTSDDVSCIARRVYHVKCVQTRIASSRRTIRLITCSLEC